MNTRRLTKKYKYKSRSKKTRRNRKSRRRVLKGGVPSVSRASSRSSGVPRGFIVNRTSGASVRPSSGSVIPGIRFAGIYKPKPKPKFNFECFYDKLINTNPDELPSIIECEKNNYVCNTTLQHVNPPGAYLNMTGLQFVNYLHGKYKSADKETKDKIAYIVSLFDQCNMSQGVRNVYDLAIIKGKVHKKYFLCYEKLYNDIYKKLFPYGNSECYPVSIAAIVFGNSTTIEEEEEVSGDDE
jgi:hypothetical protein